MVIRESRDQRSVDSYPGLFAVFHALHRLLAPRHPPHALSSLAALFLPSRPWSTSPRGARGRGTGNQDHLPSLIHARQGPRMIDPVSSKARVEFARITRMPLPATK
jgi:hypothetical protein